MHVKFWRNTKDAPSMIVAADIITVIYLLQEEEEAKR